MGCQRTVGDGRCDWHAHGFDELCLVDDDATVIGHDGRERPVSPGTLFLFRRGERHGYWNAAGQRPRLWVLHYWPDEALHAGCPELAAPSAERRVWRLADVQAVAFRGLFQRISAEHGGSRHAGTLAESAWLRLLLVTVARWSVESAAPPPALDAADPGLIAAWTTVNDLATTPAALTGALRRLPGYDALRHRFARAFGAPPHRLAAQLRMQRARNLLLETALNVREIAERVGYARQHEFARAFHRATGCSPTAWRRGAG